MIGMPEHSVDKYRDLKYRTAGEPLTAESPNGFPNSRGVLTPDDPLTQAILEGRSLDGVVLGVSQSQLHQPMHPLTRLRQYRSENPFAKNAKDAAAQACGLAYIP
ncbi:MAG: hypothetical protein AB7E52_08045 [Bdellovibrionales bacterium]